MRIDLDEHYCIVLNQWGHPVLVKHGKEFELDLAINGPVEPEDYAEEMLLN